MFGLSTIQTYAIIGAMAVITSLGGVIWVMDTKIEDKNQEIAIGIANLTAETVAHEVTEASFVETTEAYEVVRIELSDLNNRMRELSETNDELEDKLARHDLEVLSLAKPGLVQNIINNATADVMDRIEIITGGRSE